MYKVVAIDHAFIFDTLDHESLDPSLYLPRFNDHLLQSQLSRSLKPTALTLLQNMPIEEEYFYICVTKCKDHFDEIISQVQRFYQIDEAQKASIRRFLFNIERNKQVFNEHHHRLNHV
ncbi:MAG: hypothetical protein WBA16_01485 [Nonlabens sp.]